MFEYRIATVTDVHVLSQMRYEYWQEDGKDPAEVSKESFIIECEDFLKEAISTGHWTCWVAVSSGDIVSHVYIQRISKVPKPSKTKDTFGYVTNFYTKQYVRGQGIGRKLLQHARKWAKSQDFEFLLSWPSDESKDLYRQEGFTEATAFECPIRPYVN